MPRKRNRWPVPLEDRVEFLYAQRHTPKQILAMLNEDNFEEVPSIRTIQERCRELAERDRASGNWQMVDATPAEAAVVLSVLPAVIEHTSGAVRGVTSHEAKALASLAAFTEHLDRWHLYLLARSYAGRVLPGDDPLPTSDLDAYVAHRPWEGGAGRDAYNKALYLGWVAPAPGYLPWNPASGDAKADLELGEEVRQVIGARRLAAIRPQLELLLAGLDSTGAQPEASRVNEESTKEEE